LEVCQKYILQTQSQLKVHIEGLQNNIPFINLEISLLKKIPQGEGAYDGRIFYIIILNIA
jgi:septum formation topological specificity factor MinE